jgi:hypothetical protein
MFGQSIVCVPPCPTLFSLNTEVVVLLKIMLQATAQVLNKQYAPFFEMTDDELLKLSQASSNARLHNIDAEEVVGMFSAALGKAPNTTIQYIAARIKAKKNKTVRALQHQEISSEPDVFKKVINMAGEMRS